MYQNPKRVNLLFKAGFLFALAAVLGFGLIGVTHTTDAGPLPSPYINTCPANECPTGVLVTYSGRCDLQTSPTCFFDCTVYSIDSTGELCYTNCVVE